MIIAHTAEDSSILEAMQMFQGVRPCHMSELQHGPWREQQLPTKCQWVNAAQNAAATNQRDGTCAARRCVSVTSCAT